MHDKPAARQDLLVKLLDLDMYGRMAQRANLRAVEADARVKAEQQRLDDLSFASDEAFKAARAQVGGLTKLQERIDADEPQLGELRDTFKGGKERGQARSGRAGAGETSAGPDGG